jgi:hypothetical protein
VQEVGERGGGGQDQGVRVEGRDFSGREKKGKTTHKKCEFFPVRGLFWDASAPSPALRGGGLEELCNARTCVAFEKKRKRWGVVFLHGETLATTTPSSLVSAVSHPLSLSRISPAATQKKEENTNTPPHVSLCSFVVVAVHPSEGKKRAHTRAL